MLKPYFLDDYQWFKFKEELLSWVGTPYRHYQKAKGYGADCALFISACMINIGILEKMEYPYYSGDWFLHGDESFVEKTIYENYNKFLNENGLKFKLIFPNFEDNIRGDMLFIWTVKKTFSNHCSIMMEDGVSMIHSMQNVGVEVTNYGKWWKRHTRYKFRLYREV